MRVLRTPLGLALMLVLGTLALLAISCSQLSSGSSGELNPMQAEIATRQQRMAAALTQVPAAPLTVTAAPVAPVAAVLVPTGTPLPTATTPPIPTAAPAHQPAQSAVTLTGFTHEWQTWNNCGPATLAMNLSYFGSTLTQADVGTVLRFFVCVRRVLHFRPFLEMP